MHSKMERLKKKISKELLLFSVVEESWLRCYHLRLALKLSRKERKDRQNTGNYRRLAHEGSLYCFLQMSEV